MCVFCDLANDESKQLVVVRNAFVVRAIDSKGEPKAGAYLAIPNRHTPREPLGWPTTRDTMIYALSRMEIRVDNLNVNLTPQGGRTMEHYHEWLLNRDEIDGGGLGFYGTLMELQAARLEISDLQRQLRTARRAATVLDREWSDRIIREGGC